MSPYDFTNLKPGDTLAEVHGWSTPSTPVKVIKRTPKRVELENGDKVRVDTGWCETSHRRYEPWSDEREAERAERQRYDRAGQRLRSVSHSLRATCRRGTFLDIEDVLRDEATFAELESLVVGFERRRDEILGRLFAGRPSPDTKGLL